MKILWSMFVALLLLASTLPAALAEQNEQDDNDIFATATGTTCASLPSAERDDCCARKGLGRWNESANDCSRTERTAFAERLQAMTQERREKMEHLTAAQQERLMALKQERVENIASLDKVQMERLAKLDQEKLRKLAELKEERLTKIAQLDQAQLEKLAALDRARLKEYSEKSPTELKAALQRLHVNKVRTEEAYRKRVIAQQRLQEANRKHEQAKNRYQEEKRLFEQERNAWQDSVRDGDDEAAITHAKAYLGHAADVVIQSLEQLKARIEANDDLTDEEAAEMIDEIDEKIAEMEDAKGAVEAAQTKEEVKAAARTIVAAWERIRERVRINAEAVVRTDVGEILSRSEALEQRLEAVLAEMEANGVEVEDLDSKIDAFSEKIAEARELYAESEELFEKAKDEDDREAFEESKQLARQAHEKLKEAHNILVDLFKEIKQAGYEDSLAEDEYVEVITEDES